MVFWLMSATVIARRKARWPGEGVLNCDMPSPRARALRQTMTDAERRLWSALRDRRLEGYKFRRQYPIGPFILDFVCIEHRLVVEADGSQHADSEKDARRTAWLESRGWRVIRFWNNDILTNIEGVAEALLLVLKNDPSS
jgi:very-short-patch-repair endonuclease